MVPLAIEIERTDERTLLVRPEGGYSKSLFRERPVHDTGDVIRLGGLEIEVTELAPSGWPSEVRYRWEVPLEDASLVWWQVKGARGSGWTLPPVGESVLVLP